MLSISDNSMSDEPCDMLKFDDVDPMLELSLCFLILVSIFILGPNLGTISARFCSLRPKKISSSTSCSVEKKLKGYSVYGYAN